MKEKIITLAVMVLLFPLVVMGKSNNPSPIINYINSLPKEKLSAAEKKNLTYMRQEEKLARDVYEALGEKWNLPIFKNIAKSEQQHMDILKVLIEKYGLKDPLKGIENKRGKYKDKKLQKLYNQLAEKGSKDLTSALIVGATIEDLDIKDLEEALKKCDNRDIETAYLNLMKGSRNHLRSFVRVLTRYGGKYEPQYISKKEFETIITTPHERGIIYPKGAEKNNEIYLKGEIVKIEKETGWRNKKIVWWVATLEKEDGTKIKLRIDPTWRSIKPPVETGDKVSIIGYIPPYWKMEGVNEIMICSIKKGNKLATFRECNRTFSGNKNLTRSNTQIITGKVTKIKQVYSPRMKNVKWWIIQLKNKDGSLVEVRIAPTFRYQTLPIANSDMVKVKWFTPPRWSSGLMACEIENLTNGKVLKIRNCPGTWEHH